MNRLVNAILIAAVVLTSLVATSSTLSVKGKVLANGKQGSYDPFDPDLPSWRADNGPSAVDWNDEVYRLPGDLLPSVYTLRLLPFIEEGNFTTDGHVTIFVDCVNDTKNIVLNSIDIDIHKATITVLDLDTNSPLAIVGLEDLQSTLQKIVIKTADSLKSGNRYKISMGFTSILNDKLIGFYRSSYVEDGVTKFMATSDMEPAEARVAFPCFDEPDMKARFSIILGRNSSWAASSNMAKIETNPIDGMPGYVWDYFDTTPVMSTYLVAMMVSEFVSTPSDPSLSNVKFRVLTRPELQENAAYAANVGPRILEFFESFLGVDYPLAKEDLAAIPDFGPGAMENWGHIDFKESYLIVDENTTAASKQRVAEVIAHELAHMWFGDLVTMEWWTNIWLNEGFARYLQYFGADSVEPSYRLHEQFVVNTLQKVFVTDSLSTTHPMSDPELKSHVFDTIEYDKGASVIRMSAHFLGIDTFRRGLNRYLTKNSYSNTMEEDLWNTLEEQASIDGVILPDSLATIMASWTQTENYPLITVKRTYIEGDGALVLQSRFLLPIEDNIEDEETVWWVPLTYTHDFSLRPTTAWMSTKTRQLVTLAATKDQWVIFNVDQAGFYRVAYDETNYGLIADQLIADHLRISIMNRAQLLDDAFVLAKVEKISYTIAFDLTLFLKYERKYVPWRAVLDELNYIDTMFYKESQYADWKIYMTSLVKPYYDFVGFQETESDAHLTILSRNDALNWACKLKIADCVTNVQSQYAALMQEPDMRLSPNQRNFILCAGVENGRQLEWNFAYDQYRSTDNGNFLVAMTCTRESSIIYDLLSKMLDPNSIRSEDVDTLFGNLAANPIGNTMALDFLTRRWNDIEKALGTSHFVYFFRSLCDRLNTPAQYDQMIKLRDDHIDILNSTTVEQGLDIVRANVEWMTLNQEEIGGWLKNPSTATALPTTEPTTVTTTEIVIVTTTVEPGTEDTTTSTASSTASTTTTPAPTTTTPAPTTAPTTTAAPSSSGATIQPYLCLTLVFAVFGRWILHN
ncbi:aminopeptidase N-like [Daphnia pulex]|uniref:aminopeptidase N-like n=1 Tax=Daphnia pulex TaxID=6669 RepID=UPI001EE01EDD|nr:aminopeptidase N-like [Daphnia pulex]